MSPTLYLRCSDGDVAPRVLLCGDPGRLDLIASVLQGVAEIGTNREYRVITGAYAGVPLSAVSAGIGAPSTAIALEELKQVGVKTVVRVGTMMGVGAPMGAVVVPTGAVRHDGTSLRYLPIEYPAVPDWALANRLAEHAGAAGLDVHLGLSAAYDAFYPDMAPALTGEADTAALDRLRQRGVMSLDMESGLLFTAGRALELAVATICLVTVQAGAPPAFMEAEPRAEMTRRLIEAACEAVVAEPVAAGRARA